ncbi:MAG: hypothetical protein AB7O97_09515 [Planctomycetota bacterium]
MPAPFTSRCLSALLAGAALLAPTAAQARSPARELRAALPQLLDDEEAATAARDAVAALTGEGADLARAADAVDLLVDAFQWLERELEPEVQKRHRILRGDGSSMRLGRLRHRVQRGRDVQDAILAALRDGALAAAPAAGPAMREALQRAGNAPFALRLALAERAAADAEAAAAWVADAMDPRGKVAADDAIVLLRAIAALGPRAGTAARLPIAWLEHASVDVRAAAVDACVALALPQVLEPLVARLDVETGPLRERLLDALVVLTAQHPGDAGASWRAWLAAEGASFLDGTRRLGGGDAALRRRAPAAGGTAAGTYFGLPQDGSTLLYVVDRSLSMRQAGPRRGAGTTAGGRSADGESRWQYSLDELRQGIGRLRPEQRFQVMAFANRVLVWAEQPQPATAANVEAAVAWLDGLGLEYETNAYDALELSFVLAGRGARDRYYPGEIDTIFFLTDGEPTRPTEQGRLRGGDAYDDPAQVLAAVRRWNPLGRVTIHTIGISLTATGRRARNGGRAPANARQFLRDLALQNGGTFVDRR